MRIEWIGRVADFGKDGEGKTKKILVIPKPLRELVNKQEYKISVEAFESLEKRPTFLSRLQSLIR